MLEVDRVTKRYRGTTAVDDASFHARPGRILGLLGPNGAGKTSILRMVNDITKPDAGQLRLDGQPIGRHTQPSIGYMPEERGLYKQLKTIDQLTYMGRLKGLSKNAAKRAGNDWLARLEAEGWRGKRPPELSRGMQQKVQFALALVHAPRLLLLDEPFSGLDPINSKLLEEVIAERRAAGATIVVASHRMEQVEALCDDVCLIARGRVRLAGDLAEVQQRFGRDAVQLGFEGSGEFLDGLAAAGKVEILRRDAGSAELRLQGSYSADALLDAVRAATVSLHRFSASYPSLRDIFLRTVGESAAEGTPAGDGA